MAADIVFIVNPIAGNRRTGRRWRSYERRFRDLLGRPFDVRRTARRWHAAELAKQAIVDGARTLVAVGGDGTLNEIVNGYLDGTGRPWNEEACIAVLSLGTGSDFIRTLGVTREVGDIAGRIQAGRTRWIDAGLCEFVDAGAPRSRYFINVGEFGSGGAIVDRVNRTTKLLGGRMSFLIGILRTLPRYVNTRVAYMADGGPRREQIVNDVIVANGRFFGGGLMPAPHADHEDGLFDVTILGDLDFKTMRKNLGLLREGRHLGFPGITHFRCRELRIQAGEEMIDLDGEYVGRHPTRFEILPKAVRIVA